VPLVPGNAPQTPKVAYSANFEQEKQTLELFPFFTSADLKSVLHPRRKTLQAKLRVKQPLDVYEQEADRIAERVVNESYPSVPAKGMPNQISRKSAGMSGFEIPDNYSRQIEQLTTTGGVPLDSSTRRHMESQFGVDLGKVRIHNGADAEKSARSLNALAYTVGNDIVFGSGNYRPNSLNGKRLLAHELTHVIQQNGISTRIVQRDPDPTAMEQSADDEKGPIVSAQNFVFRKKTFSFQWKFLRPIVWAIKLSGSYVVGTPWDPDPSHQGIYQQPKGEIERQISKQQPDRSKGEKRWSAAQHRFKAKVPLGLAGALKGDVYKDDNLFIGGRIVAEGPALEAVPELEGDHVNALDLKEQIKNQKANQLRDSSLVSLRFQGVGRYEEPGEGFRAEFVFEAQAKLTLEQIQRFRQIAQGVGKLADEGKLGKLGKKISDALDKGKAARKMSAAAKAEALKPMAKEFGEKNLKMVTEAAEKELQDVNKLFAGKREGMESSIKSLKDDLQKHRDIMKDQLERFDKVPAPDPESNMLRRNNVERNKQLEKKLEKDIKKLEKKLEKSFEKSAKEIAEKEEVLKLLKSPDSLEAFEKEALKQLRRPWNKTSLGTIIAKSVSRVLRTKGAKIATQAIKWVGKALLRFIPGINIIMTIIDLYEIGSMLYDLFTMDWSSEGGGKGGKKGQGKPGGSGDEASNESEGAADQHAGAEGAGSESQGAETSAEESGTESSSVEGTITQGKGGQSPSGTKPGQPSTQKGPRVNIEEGSIDLEQGGVPATALEGGSPETIESISIDYEKRLVITFKDEADEDIENYSKPGIIVGVDIRGRTHYFGTPQRSNQAVYYNHIPDHDLSQTQNQSPQQQKPTKPGTGDAKPNESAGKKKQQSDADVRAGTEVTEATVDKAEEKQEVRAKTPGSGSGKGKTKGKKSEPSTYSRARPFKGDVITEDQEPFHYVSGLNSLKQGSAPWLRIYFERDGTKFYSTLQFRIDSITRVDNSKEVKLLSVNTTPLNIAPEGESEFIVLPAAKLTVVWSTKK
jgi:hypothetical protein